MMNHLKEHLQDQAHLNPESMSMTERQFHLFLAHDFDNDLLLDGIELMQSIIHEEGGRVFSDREVSQMLDPLLDRFDTDRDGKLSFAEYMMSL
ncbi:multiple coagulation factor deficiency protein 2 homolog [Panulirus ornatus]|uniref:multiple coagulation factor deficiency protein 2 homolog n=1 Tax=Panulirus ornatus TaxID=150431 RepID=UPI003A8C7042